MIDKKYLLVGMVACISCIFILSTIISNPVSKSNTYAVSNGLNLMPVASGTVGSNGYYSENFSEYPLGSLIRGTNGTTGVWGTPPVGPWNAWNRRQTSFTCVAGSSVPYPHPYATNWGYYNGWNFANGSSIYYKGG